SYWLYNNKFYLFGGAMINDLWVFDISSNTWTWIKGSSDFLDTSIYGTMNVEDTLNKPGVKQECATWVVNDKIYLLGGSNYQNDLWRYNPVTNNWTWIKGSKSPSQPGIFAPSNIYLSTNMPGGRLASQYWVVNNRCYLFGGDGYGIAGWGTYARDDYLNDMWEYDTLSNDWKWIKGSENPLQASYNSSSGITSQFNTPFASSGEMYCQMDSTFYVLGSTFDLDLWKYEPFNNTWTFLKDGASTVYGPKDSASPKNSPGTRNGSACWALNNKIYVFGGSVRDAPGIEGLENDL